MADVDGVSTRFSGLPLSFSRNRFHHSAKGVLEASVKAGAGETVGLLHEQAMVGGCEGKACLEAENAVATRQDLSAKERKRSLGEEGTRVLSNPLGTTRTGSMRQEDGARKCDACNRRSRVALRLLVN